MPGRLISVFGTYDFLGKVLPGMTLVIGSSALLPDGLIPSVNLSENFLVLLSILLIVGLIGALLGELVHSLANIFEAVVGWFLRLGWRFLRAAIDYCRGDSSDELDPNLLVNEVRVGDTDAEHDDIDEEETLGGKLRNECANWFNSQIIKIAYVVWPHRKIFYRRIRVIEDDNFRADRSIRGAGFAEEYFIKQILLEKYDVDSPADMDQIYPVVVSTLAENEYERAFQFQARSSFCRSMWLVSTLLAVSYLVSTFPPFGFIPSELIYTPYISYLDTTVVWTISALILGFSAIFAFASGAYKRYYIDYIISEMFVHSQSSEQGETTKQLYQKAS